MNLQTSRSKNKEESGEYEINAITNSSDLLNNSSTSFCLRRSSCRTDLSIHFQPSRPTTIWMFFFWVTLRLSSVTIYYETGHRKCKITLDGWHGGLRLFKLGRLHHKGFEPWSLSWIACSTGHSATTYVSHHGGVLHHRGGGLHHRVGGLQNRSGAYITVAVAYITVEVAYITVAVEYITVAVQGRKG